MSKTGEVIDTIERWARALPGQVQGKCHATVAIRSWCILVRAAWKQKCTPHTASVELWFDFEGNLFKAVIYGAGQNTVSFGVAVIEDAIFRVPGVTCNGWSGRALETWWTCGDSSFSTQFAEGNTYTFNFKETG